MQKAKVAFDTLDRVRAFQTLNRDWRVHLSPLERDFLSYVFDNTVCWGRTHFQATVPQMVTGTDYLSPVGLGRASVERALKSLRDKGVIITTFNGRCLRITVNLDWSPSVSILPVSKRQRGGNVVSLEAVRADRADDFADAAPSNRGPSPLKLRDQPPQIEGPIKGKRETEVERESSRERALTRGDSVEDVIEAIRAKPKAPTRPTKFNTRSAWPVWREAWTQTFTGEACPSWGKREQGMVRHLAEKLSPSGVDPFDFLTFAVTRWNHVRTTRFAWMTRQPAPSLPAISFLLSFATQFIEAYLDEAIQKKRQTDFSVDEAVAKHVRNGMTYEEALMAVGAERGVAKARDNLISRTAELNDMFRRADSQRQSSPSQKNHRPTKLSIDHGDNPFETNTPEIEPVDFGEWREE